MEPNRVALQPGSMHEVVWHSCGLGKSGTLGFDSGLGAFNGRAVVVSHQGYAPLARGSAQRVDGHYAARLPAVVGGVGRLRSEGPCRRDQSKDKGMSEGWEAKGGGGKC